MPNFCCVKDCKNYDRGEGIRFFLFPTIWKRYPKMQALTKDRQNRWLAALNLKNINLKNARICSRHFISGECAALKDILNPDWVPSQHLGYNSEIDPLQTKPRLKRKRQTRGKSTKLNEPQQDPIETEAEEENKDEDEPEFENENEDKAENNDVAIETKSDKSDGEFLQDYLDEIKASQKNKTSRRSAKSEYVAINCCVPMCRSIRNKDEPNRKKYKFFRFPTVDENTNEKVYRSERQTAWIKAIKRLDITHLNASNKIICSKHFVTGAPAQDKSHIDWIPTQKLPLTLTKAVKSTDDCVKTDIAECWVTSDPLAEKEIPMVVDTTDNEIETNTSVEDLKREIQELKNENEMLKQQLAAKDMEIGAQKEEMRKLDEIYKLQIQEKDKTIEKWEANHLKITLSRDSFKGDDKKVTYMTGLPSLAVLDIIYNFVKDDLVACLMRGVNKFDALILVLVKLRLDLPMSYLGYRFGIAGNTTARIFHSNLKILSQKIGPFIRWPEKSTPGEATCVYFKKVLGNRFTALIDFIEDPGPDVSQEYLIQKNYKHRKYLVAISPAGAIIFVSKGYDSSLSVKEIAESCGVLDYTDDGDIILSDYGKAAHQVISYNGSKVLVPSTIDKENDLIDSLLENPSQLSTDGSTEKDNSRIYIQRSLSVLKTRYFVLTNKHNHGVAKSYKSGEGEAYFDYVVKVCCALTNVSPAIITLDTKKS